MDKLERVRNAQLAQVKRELAAAEKLGERKASIGEATDRLELLKELAGKFRLTQESIEQEQENPEVIASVHDYREEFNESYYAARNLWEKYIVDNNPDETGSTDSGHTVIDGNGELREAMRLLLNTQRTMMERSGNAGGNLETAGNNVPNVRLPAIDVPKFSGERKHWSSFKDIYTTTIHNRNDLRPSLKMQYLVSYVDGFAQQLVGRYSISDAHYEEAWTALTDYYDKKKFTVFALVREFVEQPAVEEAVSGKLRKLATTSDEVVRQLNALGAEFNTRDPWLIHILLEKLDDETRSLWAQRIVEVDNPSLDDFLKFLGNRCDALETCSAFSKKVSPNGPKKETTKKPPSEKKVQSLYSAAVEEKCAKCSKEHPLYQCDEFRKMDLQCKRDLVAQEKLCYNCLRSSHIAKSCSSKSVCRNADCKQRHHTLLCPKSTVRQVVNESATEENSTIDPVVTMVAQVPADVPRKAFILPTAIIRIRGVDGRLIQARALVDSGSEASLISESCVSKLGLPRANGKVAVTGMGQQAAGTTRGVVKLEIANRFDDTSVLQTMAYVMGKLTSTLPTQLCQVHPSLLDRDVQDFLADPAYQRPGPIDLILGCDVFLALLRPGQVKDDGGVPVAQNTIFGWIVSGNQAIYTHRIQANVSIVNLHAELDINRTLRMFWEQEEIPKPAQLTPSEEAAAEFFKSTLSREKDGRFIVRLPFDESKPALGESLGPAIKRLRSMERRFRSDSEFHKLYSDFLTEYQALGHMEEVPANEVEVEAGKCCYLPHHAVVKDSTTTKLRVVFDASCATSTGVSLNDRLLAGPNVNQELFSVFLRFRTYKVAFTADAEKMYRQVWVHPADRNYQRIVFRETEDQPIKHYRLCTVTYGTKCAPYLAIESMKQAASEFKLKYPEAVQKIELDTYVDDFLSGAQTVQRAKELKSQVVEILESAGFHLRKWTTNCPELLQHAAETDQTPVEVNLDERANAVKALGILWHPKEDEFSFKVNLSPNSVNTKRQLLSDSSKLFDPFGWLAPVTIKIKILYQHLWLCELSWDDGLPATVEPAWKEIKETLHLLEQIRIRRFAPNKDGKIELHGFSDASEAAYSAVVYAREPDETGQAEMNLLAAKTKVAPIRQVCVPRLELNGGTLLANLMLAIVQALSHLEVELYAYTDSSIVLHWLSAHPRKWKTYVANRTSAILEVLPRDRWSHVRSENNPADCASRGLTPAELVAHPMWPHGPKEMNSKDDSWKNVPLEPIDDEDLLETRQLKVLHSTAMVIRTDYSIESRLLARRSSYTLIVRTLAYVNRFLLALKSEDATLEPGLSPNEIYDAKAQLARLAQHDAYEKEIQLLLKGEELPAKDKLSALHPFIRHNASRRAASELLASVRCQAPHHLAGQLGLQAAVRQAVQGCARCVRLKGRTASQLMGSLPVTRVMGTRAFAHVGVDYAGPVKVHASCVRGVKTTKGYIVVFVCMATKAVHLELASDLSTNTFIGALKRFVSRRSHPNEMWSDCGTNFVGADTWLKEIRGALEKHNVAANRFLTNLGIKWVFNPPSAPHRGGLWEAAVKSAKKHLVAVLGSDAATFEELSTVLTQVEACLNSRPLCPLSADPDSYEALTPGHFLVGQPLNLIPEPGVQHLPMNRLDKWQLVHRHTTDIWSRWRDEYLAHLQPRTKWRTTETNVKEDQLVLVKNDNAPPTQWELARIVKLHPDASGVVRTVTLRRGQAEYLRTVQKICVLPTD
ncbi:uncharacterized protein LOC119766211 [Culex quinquefasciatus]|uniref:uncharacterized protein LOC119766211 n=1 Tax=Culex quinquefasciatus TaxID=7176 RepID=UPI0018E3C018|nr:uncharacterized protein LOC119766211 [Culex quinquefasciatus]